MNIIYPLCPCRGVSRRVHKVVNQCVSFRWEVPSDRITLGSNALLMSHSYSSTACYIICDVIGCNTVCSQKLDIMHWMGSDRVINPCGPTACVYCTSMEEPELLTDYLSQVNSIFHRWMLVPLQSTPGSTTSGTAAVCCETGLAKFRESVVLHIRWWLPVIIMLLHGKQ